MGGFMPPMPNVEAGMPPHHAQRNHKANRGGRHEGHKKKKKVQRGLESNVRRTVYISYIDQNVSGTPFFLNQFECRLREFATAASSEVQVVRRA